MSMWSSLARSPRPPRLPRRAESDRGVTLVEATVVLLAVTILAGAAAPTVKRAVDQAKLTRAVSDEQAIKTAILNFMSELAAYTGFTQNGQAGGATTETLVSDGDVPREVSASGSATWQTLVNGTTVDFLERHLVTDNPGGNVANAYPTANGWRGAYLNPPIDPDPWGNRYAVNVKWLKDASRANDVFVLSAGPDEEIDSLYQVNGAVPGDDDIILIVRRDIGLTTP